jgi:hypothetical protein
MRWVSWIGGERRNEQISLVSLLPVMSAAMVPYDLAQPMPAPASGAVCDIALHWSPVEPVTIVHLALGRGKRLVRRRDGPKTLENSAVCAFPWLPEA